MFFSFTERLKNPQLLSKFRRNKPDFKCGTLQLEDIAFDFFAYTLEDDDNEILPLKGTDLILCRGLIENINKDINDFSAYLRYGLYKAFISKKPTANLAKYSLSGYKLNEECFGEDAPEYKPVQKCIGSIRNILDEAYRSFKKNPVIYSNTFKMTAFFNIIRFPYARVNFGYSAQILFSNDQKLAMENNTEKKFSVSTLEERIRGESVALSDRCFRLHTVQFGLMYNSTNQVEQTREDQERRSSEDQFYREVLDGQDPETVYYVPIHVNGNAWIAMYKILPKVRGKISMSQWSVSYEMYNQYTLLISEKIRLKAKEKYFELLRRFIEETAHVSKDVALFIHDVRVKMYVLGAFFPFPVPIFKEDVFKQPIEQFLMQMTEATLQLTINRLWDGEVTYDTVDFTDLNKTVIEICRKAGRDVNDRKIGNERISAAYRISHFYGNRIHLLDAPIKLIISTLKRSGQFPDELKKQVKEYDQEVKSLKEISELVTIISKQFTERVPGPFFENCKEKKYLKQGPFDLRANILKNFTSLNTNSIKKINIRPSSILITPYIGDDLRPFDELYDNLTLEIVKNFFYATLASVEDELTVDGVFDRSLNGHLVYFKNKISKETDGHYQEEWIEVHSGKFWGALFYLHIMLCDTSTGGIYYRYEQLPNSNEVNYCCGLKLNHLTYAN